MWGNSAHFGMQWTDHALTSRPGVAAFIMNTLRSIWNTTLNTWEAVKHLGARLYSFWSDVLIMAPIRQGPRHLTVKVNGVMWLLFGLLLFGDPPTHTCTHTHTRACRHIHTKVSTLIQKVVTVVVDVNCRLQCRGTLRSNHSRYFSLKLGFTKRLPPAYLPPVL